MKIHFAILLAVFSLGTSSPTSKNEIQQAIIQPNDKFNLTPVRDALVSNKVIGDVLDDFEPTYYVDLMYPKRQTRVLLGNEIKPNYLQKRPSIGIQRIPTRRHPGDKDDQSDKTFTLILTDPDATSRYNPKWSEMCHWIVTNLTAKSSELSSILDFHSGLEVNAERKLDGIMHRNKPVDELEHGKRSTCSKKKNKERKKHQNKDERPENELVSYFPPAPPPKTGFHRYVFVLLEGDATHLKAPRERKHWGYGKIRHGVRDWAAENGLTVVGANFFFSLNKKQR